jgi:superfamily II DNA or RNA helicase
MRVSLGDGEVPVSEPIRLDRLLWLPKDDIDVDKIKSSLTVATFDFKGDPADLIRLYEDAGDVIGVPRSWGLRHFGDTADILDSTVFPESSWTTPAWGEGGGFWAGQESCVDDCTKVLSGDPPDRYGCLLEAPCGAGKTLMAVSIAARLNTPTLVLVHKGDLAKQWHDLCSGTDERPGLWPDMRLGHVQQDKIEFEDCHLVTAMAQTLYSRKSRMPEAFFKHFGLVIYDEGHRYPARTFEKVMRLPYARCRLGISATWRRSDKLECIWNWHIGKVASRAKVARLQGDYAQILWDTNLTDSMMKMYGGQINRNSWVTAIISNVAYNHWLADQVVSSQKSGRRVLIVSDRVKHCENLSSIIRRRLAEEGVASSVGMYLGSMSSDKLEASKKCNVVIATYQKMSEGTDIPELDTLFLATPRTDVEQVVGRIQRIVEGKKPLLVVDPVFSSPYNQRMAKKRLGVFKKLGFKSQESKK